MSNVKDELSVYERKLVNKRLSVNLLIQGAATQALWTSHHLVADSLSELDPNFVSLYDRILLHARLGYWVGGLKWVAGHPVKFWKRITKNGHAFGYHPFFVKHGMTLAKMTRQDVMNRCKSAGISTSGIRNEFSTAKLYLQVTSLEMPHLGRLQWLAKQACSEIYGIQEDLLDGEITPKPKFGNIRVPQSVRGKIILKCMIGWSAVVRNAGRLEVKAKATIWPLLLHELVKGSVELICLHGMNELTEHEYDLILEHTDHIQYEIPMLQIVDAFFRQFLKIRPRDDSLANCIMHFARLDPDELEELTFEMFEAPDRAADRLRDASKTH